nr:hypothetical protein CFP56_79349 [Quercus suber]
MGAVPQGTHPDLILVELGKSDYSSRAVSLKSFDAGEVFSQITGTTSTSERTFATVQTGKDSDIELNTDLVFCNHSCDPSVVFDMHRGEVRVVDDRPLRKGQDVTFFYPSTEWDMRQPFQCNCGSPKCVGEIKGARYLSPEILDRYWLNPHIEELRRDASKSKATSTNGTNGTNGTSLPN